MFAFPCLDPGVASLDPVGEVSAEWPQRSPGSVRVVTSPSPSDLTSFLPELSLLRATEDGVAVAAKRL